MVLSEAQKALLRKEITAINLHGLDWSAAITREFEVISKPENQSEVAQISAKYVATLRNSATLPELEAAIASLSQPVRQLIPLPKRVLEQKQKLEIELQKAGETLR